MLDKSGFFAGQQDQDIRSHQEPIGRLELRDRAGDRLRNMAFDREGCRWYPRGPGNFNQVVVGAEGSLLEGHNSNGPDNARVHWKLPCGSEVRDAKEGQEVGVVGPGWASFVVVEAGSDGRYEVCTVELPVHVLKSVFGHVGVLED